MSDLGFNIWGVITGALGILALLPFAWLYTQFPSRKLRSLERFMDETEGMFHKDLQEGLHTRDTELFRFHTSILAIKLRIDDIRRTVKTLSSWRSELKGWSDGISGKISTLRGEINKLRSELQDSSSRDRKRLAEEGYAGMLAKYSSAQSQERRSTILSYATSDSIAPLMSGVIVEPRQDDVQYPLAPRTESPSPILDPGASRSPDPRSPAHPPVGEDRLFVSNAVTHDLALNVIDALHARRGEPVRGRRVERRDVLHRFGRHLLAPAPAARPYFTGYPSERSGDARIHLGPLSEVLPSYYQSDVVVLQGDGGVVHLYLGPFEMVSHGYACNSEHDSDDENNA